MWSIAAIDWVAIGTFVTAAGTLALALATVYLGRQTRDAVDTARQEAHAVNEGLAVGRDQAKIARLALDAQTAPLLSSVPAGLARDPDSTTAVGEVVSWRDAGRIDASIYSVSTQREGIVSVPFRNIGNGVAVIRTVTVILSGNTGFTGNSESPAVPPGERSRAVLVVPANSPHWGEAEFVLASYKNFSVVVTYADPGGQARGAVRFDIYFRPPPATLPWYVRQVHFADTYENVVRTPSSSSAPVR